MSKPDDTGPASGQDGSSLGHQPDAIAAELAAIVRGSDDAIFSKSLDGTIRTWNRAAERLYGYMPSEIIGRPVSLLVPPDRPDEIPDLLRRLARGETVDHFRTVRRRNDGGLVDVSLTVSPIQDSEGRVVGASTIARDITERVEALRDQDFLLDVATGLQSTFEAERLGTYATRRLSEHLSLAACALADVDVAHDICFPRALYARNPAGLRYGSHPLSALADGIAEWLVAGNTFVVEDAATDPRTRGEANRHQLGDTSTRAFMAVPMMRGGRLSAMLLAMHDEPREWSERETRLAREVAARLWPALEAARSFAAEREARLAAETARMENEIALGEAHAAFSEVEKSRAEAQALAAGIEQANQELVRLAATAEAANRAKSQFLAVMSHELRTPLTAIAGYAQLLEMGLFGALTEKQLAQIRRIQAAEEHLLRIIEGVLAFTRVEVGKLSFDLEDFAAADVLAGLDTLLGLQAESAGVELMVGSAPPDALIRADREKLRQVILNLVANAIKFTPRGGRVRIECQPVGDEVVVRVHDTGIGIPADKLETIFEPFTQVDMANTREYGGTGLGLAISREFARGMGGDVSVVSVLGVGSIFSVRLPAGEARAREREGREGKNGRTG